MNKYIINVYTNWAGTEEGYAAIAENEEDLYGIADQLAYDNFLESRGPENLIEELFPGKSYVEDLDEDEEAKYYEVEMDAFGATIILVETEEDEKIFELLERIN